MKQLADNYGIAFFTFYLLIPFYAAQISNFPLIVLVVIICLSVYHRTAEKIYLQFSTKHDFFRDSTIMLMGLMALYLYEFLSLFNPNNYHLMVYMLLSLTYLPSAFRFEKIKKMAV